MSVSPSSGAGYSIVFPDSPTTGSACPGMRLTAAKKEEAVVVRTGIVRKTEILVSVAFIDSGEGGEGWHYSLHCLGYDQPLLSPKKYFLFY